MTQTEEIEFSKLLQENAKNLESRLKYLHALEEWAEAQQPFKAGDHVCIRKNWSFDRVDSWGWSGFEECLVGGATAVVRRVYFSIWSKDWSIEIVLDNEWSGSVYAGEITRYWNGPACETPDWCQTPSDYDQKTHPEGIKHTWRFKAENLRRVK